MRSSEAILEMRGITKDFPGVRALDKVYFSCQRGEIRALVGENGAGKSTLMKILAGVYQPEEGEIILQGKKVSIHNPKDAQKLGISIIYQEFNLVPYLTVAQNIFLGREPRFYFRFVDSSKLYRQAAIQLDKIQACLSPKEWISNLTVAQQQLVEIAKALSWNSKIIVMDEPTAALSTKEIKRLFEIIKDLRRKGVTIIFISHRLKEIFEIADSVTVLKDGKVVATENLYKLTEEDIVSMMIGRELSETFPQRAGNHRREEVMKIRQLTRKERLKNINLSLYKGEIVGIAGLEGHGQRTLIRTLFGAESMDKGEIYIRGKKVRITSPKEAIKLGIGFVPSDRKEEGLILNFSVKENIALPSLDKREFWGFIRENEEEKIVDKIVSRMDIKTPTLTREVRYLSGGNQQKVMLAKWLIVGPQVIILDEPTRGIDVSTKIEIYYLMRRLSQEGKAILMLSTDMMEILGISDRIIVMYEGEIVREFSAREATEEKIIRAMSGLIENKGKDEKDKLQS